MQKQDILLTLTQDRGCKSSPTPARGAMITRTGINSKQEKRNRTFNSHLIWMIETPESKYQQPENTIT